MGIEPEDREKIFEAFFRSRPAVEQDPAGVGLGLKIVRHIMDARSGRVEVESEPGKGSVFRLVFPRQEAVKTFFLEKRGKPGGLPPFSIAYLSANAKTVRKPCWLILAMRSPLTFSTLSLVWW